MFLNYLALFMILVVLVIIYYTFIYIHELPYEAAKHRNHPHADAIYVACWISLFTLHAIWPLVFIWALCHKDKSKDADASAEAPGSGLADRIAHLENRLKHVEKNHAPSVEIMPAEKSSHSSPKKTSQLSGKE
jgi:hypothetical protein